MAQDVLGKVVRIDDTSYNPDGAKVEVWTKGRHKYIKWYRDEKNGLISTENYIEGDKISASLSDDEVLTNWLAQYEKRSKVTSSVKAYKIIQDPYDEKPVLTRTYGGKSPYYLNNGCYVTIKWIGQLPNPEFTIGSYSTADDAEAAGDDKSPKRWLSNTTNLQLGYKIIEDAEITSSVDDSSNLNTLLPISTWKDSSGNFDRPQVSGKVAKVFLPDGVKEEGEYLACTRGFGSSILAYNTKTVPENQEFKDFVYNGILQSGAPNNQLKSFRYDDSDSDILKRIIQSFVYQVKQLHGVSDYDLKLCSPDSATCSVIEYKSPLKGKDNTLDETISENPVISGSPSNTSQLIKLIVFGLPEQIVVDAKTDLPEFKVYCNELPPDENNIDDFESLGEEYTETGFMGLEELGITAQVWSEQDSNSKNQEDSVNNGGEIGNPANIKPYSSFNQLIDLAGDCARELGKNPRVNATNMKMSYKDGVHGLCPQGTQAVLYALTGVKSLGQLSGNADWFSFKSPTIPAGGDFKGNFANTGYFNQKVKISQLNGSWKGTYLTDKKQWQVGDVIAMGYTSRSYGHIQVWTGYSWMSDFKQGDAIQQRHVDPESVALWRLNEKGVAAVNKQSNKLA